MQRMRNNILTINTKWFPYTKKQVKIGSHMKQLTECTWNPLIQATSAALPRAISMLKVLSQTSSTEMLGRQLNQCQFKICWIEEFHLSLVSFAGRTETTHFSTRKHLSAITRILIPPKEGGGGTPGNSWWGCATRFSKSWPYFRLVIFPTRFQTWHRQKSSHHYLD